MTCRSVGHACLLRELYAVDDVAAVARQRHIALFLDADERGLANWPAMRPTLTTGLLRTEGQDDGHLQKGAEEIADRIGACSAKLSAQSPPCKQEAAALGNIGKRALETARLSREDKRRILGKTRLHAIERCEVRISPAPAEWVFAASCSAVQVCAISNHLLSDAGSARVAPCGRHAARHPDLHASASAAPPIPADLATTPGRTTFADAGL